MNSPQPTQPSTWRLLAPNAVTCANVAAGFLAMVMAADGRYEAAVYLLLLALTLDTLDGAVARWLHATSEFGQEMDSFSDALSFGAAPALLLYLVFLRDSGPLGVALALFYLLSSVFRLTRFVLTSGAHDKERRTRGLPVPIGASYIMAMVLMRDHITLPAVVAVTVIFSVSMASRMRLPNLTGRNYVTYMLLVGVVNFYAVVFAPSWITVGWWTAWNFMIIIAAHVQDRRLDQSSA